MSGELGLLAIEHSGRIPTYVVFVQAIRVHPEMTSKESRGEPTPVLMSPDTVAFALCLNSTSGLEYAGGNFVFASSPVSAALALLAYCISEGGCRFPDKPG